MSEPKGVVACFIDENGDVIASASDFELSGFGGFALSQAQRIRCKKKLNRAVAEAYASSNLVRSLDSYDLDRIVNNLVADHKCRIHYHYVGQDAEE